MLANARVDDSVMLAYWTFSDGVPIHDEMKNAKVDIIRAICNLKSGRRWAKLCSRQNLYEFIASLDIDAQMAVRHAVQSALNVGCRAGHTDSTTSTSSGFDERMRIDESSSNKDASVASDYNTYSLKRRQPIDHTLMFFDGQNMHNTLYLFSILNLRKTCQRHFSCSRATTRTAIYRLISQASTVIQERIREEVKEAVQKGFKKYARRRPSLSAGEDDEDMDCSGDGIRLSAEERVVNELCENSFMRMPPTKVIDDARAEFIDRTSNGVVAVASCGSCAQETLRTELMVFSLDAIPNGHNLKPAESHPRHDLYRGMLLHPKGVDVEETSANLCQECARALKMNKVPMLALANKVWIGEIPDELRFLTLPERILVAKYLPVAYVIKLYPRKLGACQWDQRQMHSGLKENVSTYRLDQSQIASMIDGTLMPPIVKVLAATIGITFVGPKNIPERTMPKFFRVRRNWVRKALEWLRANNPLYNNIIISHSRLAALPEDGVPYELMATAKHSTDVDMLYTEEDSYVPLQDVEDVEDMRDVEEASDNEHGDLELPTEPGVLPLAHLGVVDVDGVEVTDSELLAHALANCCEGRQEEDYMIRRGSAFVNEYARIDPTTGQRNDGGPSDANHLLGSFPTLFPFGQGGFEIDREVNVPYEMHVRWALRYEDKRFREDHQFPFQVFGVCQKRQVCRSSCIQMKKESFFRNQNVLSSISADDLTKASREETRGVPFSNPAIRIFRGLLSTVKTKVQGSDESRKSIRGKIWGMNLLHNPPSLWVTINPSDTQDPIAQVFAGADIDLDSFCETAGPDSIERAINIASDPYASAKYFHFVIGTILEVLIGVTKHRNGMVTRKEGIFGLVKSYIGTVEAQGRGSLHLHLLLWLDGAPTARELKTALKNSVFREKIKRFVGKTIRADIDGKSSAEVVGMKKVDSVSYSRPLDPRKTADMKSMTGTEFQLARMTQLHQCSIMNCLKVVKGRMMCKRRAPFPLAGDDWVDSSGGWGPKRLCGFLNNWNPPLLMSIRANHDVKLFMNGRDTNVLTWYITNYASKKQQRSSNVSALLAKRIAFHKVEEKGRVDVVNVSKRLIQRCVNTLTREREFSGPEVISYLMGWGDRFESHHHVSIYTDALISAVKRKYPGLGDKRCDENLEGISQSRNHAIAMDAGVITLKDQLHEYMYRGQEVSDMNLLTFLLETYDGKGAKEDDRGENDDIVSVDDDLTRPGRRRNRRVAYREGFNKTGRCRVFRTEGHETLPQFVGCWMPRNDKACERNLYCASMLALLKPWNDLGDLKTEGETFEDSFQQLLNGATKKTHDIIENIQYYYECYDGAKKREEEARFDGPDRTVDFEEEASREDQTTNSFDYMSDSVETTEEDIEFAYDSRGTMREKLYAQVSMDTAMGCGIFSDIRPHTVYLPNAVVADTKDVIIFRRWEEQLKTATRKEAEGEGPTLFAGYDLVPQVVPMVEPGVDPFKNGSNIIPMEYDPSGRDENICWKKRVLNEEQRRAHDIIEKQLLKRLAGKETTQLRMLVLGQGGTGKSMVIGAITETFEALHAADKLAKCGTSGVAAVIIGGQTYHSWAGIPINKPSKDNWVDTPSREISKRRKQNRVGNRVKGEGGGGSGKTWGMFRRHGRR
ncbi:hypothetical protein BYT27DRAFT_7248501 [Phlegmacium glaucopus]|nr:hypothetical protein BYT27DRAFT_7248501 [Phlegmacium glaucopus]